MRSPTRRRVLALAALTATTAISGSIAVADGTDAGDVAARALATTPAGAEVDATPMLTTAQAVRVRALRAPAVAPRTGGFATEPEPEPEPEPEEAPVEETSPVMTWVASWYGPGFHGNLTANGETYDQWAMTAAHKTLAFGTELQITNPANGASVVVRINDRGPFIDGRDIDLSAGAADALGIDGVASVEVVQL